MIVDTLAREAELAKQAQILLLKLKAFAAVMDATAIALTQPHIEENQNVSH